MLESSKRIEIPSKEEAWEVKGSIWRDADKIIFMDQNGQERVLSTLQTEILGEVLQEDTDSGNFGSQIDYVTSKPFEGLRLFRNGLRQSVTVDFSLVTIGDHTSIRLVKTLAANDILMADFTTKEI